MGVSLGLFSDLKFSLKMSTFAQTTDIPEDLVISTYHSPDNVMNFNDSSVDLSTIRAVAVSIASAAQLEREVIRREDLERAFSDGKVYGSEGLRCMRKSIINMAHAVAQRSEEIEDKNNNKESSNNNKPSSVESPRKKLTLPGYSLGDIPSHTQHMILPSTLKEGVESASTLQPLDFAFILRSNGTWTYAVVCEILNCNINNKPSIKFVVDRQGRTRTIPKKYWGKYICLINEDHAIQVMNSDATSQCSRNS